MAGGKDTVVAGIDLGGTHARIALIDGRGRLRAWEKRTGVAALGPAKAVEALADAVARLAVQAAAPAAVGLGMPGPLDLRRGVAVAPPNMPAWHGAPVLELLAHTFGLPVHLERDSNAALLGERWRGAARGRRHAVLLTLGTGIGGAALVNGRLLRGRDGLAGEFGHMTVDIGGPPCGCGNRGCLEAIASGTALRRRTGRDAAEVFAAARAGDPDARAAVADAARALGAGLAGLVNLLNPEAIVIGGGLLTARDLLWEPMLAEMERRALAPAAAGVAVVPARLGDAAGAYGAAYLALRGEKV